MKASLCRQRPGCEAHPRRDAQQSQKQLNAKVQEAGGKKNLSRGNGQNGCRCGEANPRQGVPRQVSPVKMGKDQHGKGRGNHVELQKTCGLAGFWNPQIKGRGCRAVLVRTEPTSPGPGGPPSYKTTRPRRSPGRRVPVGVESPTRARWEKTMPCKKSDPRRQPDPQPLRGRPGC